MIVCMYVYITSYMYVCMYVCMAHHVFYDIREAVFAGSNNIFYFLATQNGALAHYTYIHTYMHTYISVIVVQNRFYSPMGPE